MGGDINLGAVGGGVVGSVGGLFAVGIPPAVVLRSLQALFSTPKIAIICFFIAGIAGLILGGQLGIQLRKRRALSPKAELIAGGVAGLIPVILVMIWSYHMVTTY
jgi:hypothetical protein